MSNTFSHTMRSLKADSYAASLIGTGIALILLTSWCMWFFFAEVTIYKISLTAHITKDESITAKFSRDASRVKEIRQNRVVAGFSPEDIADIHAGQSAEMYIDGQIGKKIGTLQAIVTETENRNGKSRVGLATILPADSPIHLKEGMTGKVMVRTKYVSPAKMVMRISGMFAK